LLSNGKLKLFPRFGDDAHSRHSVGNMPREIVNGSDQVWTTKRLFVSVQRQQEGQCVTVCQGMLLASERCGGKIIGNVALPRIVRLLPSSSALQVSDVDFIRRHKVI
jgi:hypothetical protein